MGLLFNQLTAHLFAFSGIRFDKIVDEDCIKQWNRTELTPHQNSLITPINGSRVSVSVSTIFLLIDCGFLDSRLSLIRRTLFVAYITLCVGRVGFLL
jgi:hypothetical protein